MSSVLHHTLCAGHEMKQRTTLHTCWTLLRDSKSICMPGETSLEFLTQTAVGLKRACQLRHIAFISCRTQKTAKTLDGAEELRPSNAALSAWCQVQTCTEKTTIMYSAGELLYGCLQTSAARKQKYWTPFWLANASLVTFVNIHSRSSLETEVVIERKKHEREENPDTKLRRNAQKALNERKRVKQAWNLDLVHDSSPVSHDGDSSRGPITTIRPVVPITSSQTNG